MCALLILLLPHGCSNPGSGTIAPLRYHAVGNAPEVLAVYEAWFGHPAHISVNYNSHDPAAIKNQIHHAQAMGISGFVVDWYGDREPFIDESYALLQKLAAKNKFHIAMMYDESNESVGATDEAIADFKMFHDAYLSPSSPAHEAYLSYEGRPVILIFPKGMHTDWNKVRASVSSWNPAPLLIYEGPAGPGASAFDGFYPWFYIGSKGWAADGGNWGEDSLAGFYQTMRDQHPDKIIMGGAWSQFNDSKATWGLNRQIAARCGQTFQDTFNLWRRVFRPDEPIPFMLIETWNDYEEGSAVEAGVPTCNVSAPANRTRIPAPAF